jgi:phosphoenolpyruvate synthase/pyruvate phosphate dikinase
MLYSQVARETDEVLIELALGLGEVLASAVEQGSPYRLCYHKDTQDVQILEYANFSHAIYVDPHASKQLLIAWLDKPKRVRVDYIGTKYMEEDSELFKLGKQLGEVAVCIEQHYGTSQDIEGALYNNEIYIVQSRPQV